MRRVLASPVAALLSAFAALSCCLPLGPFLLAFGSAGASGLFVSLQPYLIGFSLLMLAIGFVQAFRARQCGRRRRVFNIVVLLCSTGLVALMLFANVTSGGSVTAFHAAEFQQSFNAAADRTRIVVLLSPT